MEAWKTFFSQKYPGIRIVEVESYAEKEITAVHQGKRHHEPSIPNTFRQNLIEAIKHAHRELNTPPEKVQSDPERLRHWVPPVKQNIDWNALQDARGDLVGLHANSKEESDDEEDVGSDAGSEGASKRQSLEYLTVGLIGTQFARIKGCVLIDYQGNPMLGNPPC